MRHAAFEALITEITVRTMTASTLLRHAPSPVVYLQIDAEGHDDRVLRQFLSNDTSTPWLGVPPPPSRSSECY